MFFDWFGKNWTPKLIEPAPLWKSGPEMATEVKKSRELFATDNTMERAELIVWALGFKGDVTTQEKKVYEILKTYNRLDKENETTE